MNPPTAADAAYAAAVAEIERVRAEGETFLYLNAERFRALNRIPSEITGIDGLENLNLSHTQVSDLSPLQALTGLQKLYLSQTHVSNLRPIRDLPKLKNLWFPNTPAAQSTPELILFSKITDVNDRTTQTLAYLKTLPPWPEPLAWETPPPGPGRSPAPDPAQRCHHGHRPVLRRKWIQMGRVSDHPRGSNPEGRTQSLTPKNQKSGPKTAF